ncbi:hypothetical protein ATANTOWER_015382 [Ataeniobius toweri]|uniref:Uncharacterized protein n=1 Tax=Ataeniobius toweri TaxID=208326 RepID=A0ABU7BIU1_9TELE|nr:hypothetical protein [Ataeniobius toweri]
MPLILTYTAFVGKRTSSNKPSSTPYSTQTAAGLRHSLLLISELQSPSLTPDLQDPTSPQSFRVHAMTLALSPALSSSKLQHQQCLHNLQQKHLGPRSKLRTINPIAKCPLLSGTTTD